VHCRESFSGNPWLMSFDAIDTAKELQDSYLTSFFNLGQYVPLVHAYACMTALDFALSLVSSAHRGANARDRREVWEYFDPNQVAKSIRDMERLSRGAFLYQEDRMKFHLKSYVFVQGIFHALAVCFCLFITDYS
jgi:hypothetical protein